MTLVWLPFTGPDEVRRRLGDLPAGVDADCYGATGDEVPGSIAEVELYVLPYMRPGALRLMARMPRLRVVQTLTAGVDDVAPHVPAGVTLCNAAGGARREHRRAGRGADAGQRSAPRRVRAPAGPKSVALGAGHVAG